MKYGTPYFATYTNARDYYAQQDETREAVDLKIKEKSIFIDILPPRKPGDKVFMDSDGRYWIEEKN